MSFDFKLLMVGEHLSFCTAYQGRARLLDDKSAIP